jgi:hypothetical protein
VLGETGEGGMPEFWASSVGSVKVSFLRSAKRKAGSLDGLWFRRWAC